MSDFALRAVVREVLDNSSEADPGVIAETVIGKVPPKMLRAALRQTMRLYVRQIIREARTSGPVTPNRIGHSAKVQGIREGWQRLLRDRVHVGNAQWKLLADCTYEDLLAAADEHREHAERNQAWARQYDAWARLLVAHGADRFGDLPVEAQMTALGRAA